MGVIDHDLSTPALNKAMTGGETRESIMVEFCEHVMSRKEYEERMCWDTQGEGIIPFVRSAGGKDSERYSKQSMKSQRNELPDEIALRDEIFQLKRQIVLLKKANEKNVIKVRKYEDEAKKKDRQIEELMDPVKNGDVRKLLSTKGAALLLNLKEQNNTLIQMILDKDVQIRKLLSEIKTSKLYANTRRYESYKNEIERLRNLLIKSQSLMKEAQEVPQRRSICVGGTPALEMTLSSDQSSPRGLEELQFTIQSLEMHMKYSNDLLVQKNQQISRLQDQLDNYRCSTCKKVMQTMVDSRKNLTDYSQIGNAVERETSTLSSTTQATDGNTYEIISPKSTILFDKSINGHQKTQQEKKRLPNSAPAGSVRNVQDSSDESLRELEDQSNNSRQCFLTERDQQSDINEEGNWIDGKIRFRLAKAKNQMDKLFIHDNMKHAENVRIETRNSRSSVSTTDDSDMETAEFELMEKKIENDQIEVESPVKLKPPTIVESDGLSDSSSDSSLSPEEEIRHSTSLGLVDQIRDRKTSVVDGGSQESLTVSEKDTVRTVFASEDTDIDSDKGMRQKILSVEDQNQMNERDPYIDFNGQSPVLSYDSESSTSSVLEVEVEAEINHNCVVEENPGSGPEEEILVVQEETNEEDSYGDDDDDDNDVIIN